MPYKDCLTQKSNFFHILMDIKMKTMVARNPDSDYESPLIHPRFRLGLSPK